jgi:hypothetical protein
MRREEKNFLHSQEHRRQRKCQDKKKIVYPRTTSTMDGRVHIRFSCRMSERIHLK